MNKDSLEPTDKKDPKVAIMEYQALREDLLIKEKFNVLDG